MKISKQFFSITRRLENKAHSSMSKIKISAVAFTKRGNLLGIESNGFRELTYGVKNGVSDCFFGKGKHAEMALMKKFGKQIDTIYLFRVGKGKEHRKIDPCNVCAQTAKKLGIKIVSLTEYLKDEKNEC